jgi:hypothetical protein
MKRGLGCSYRPMESNGSIPARAAGSFIACISLALSRDVHCLTALPPPAAVNPRTGGHAYSPLTSWTWRLPGISPPHGRYCNIRMKQITI